MLGVAAFVCTKLNVWPVSNFTQKLPTTRNGVCKRKRKRTCKIQQCWEFLANNVASVCTRLYTAVALSLLICLITLTPFPAVIMQSKPHWTLDCVASVSVWFWSKKRPRKGSRGLWILFLVLCSETAGKRLLRRLPHLWQKAFYPSWTIL